jgi:dihydrofolate reductase/GNAT superfamily N-acetyltransferase
MIEHGLALRPPRPEDFAWFYEQRRDGFREPAELAFGPWLEDKQRAFAAKDFEEIPILIAERSDGERVGYVVIVNEADHVFLDELVISRAHRDAGHGTALVRHAIAQAEARGHELRLSVLATNVRALALYERLGFRTTRVEPPRVKLTYHRRPRPRCSVFIATSLDGYIARTDGGIDWLSIVDAPGEDYGFAAFYATVDALVIGRATYETALGFATWPYAGRRVVVLTTRPAEARHDVRFARGTPAEVLATLDDGTGAHVYVDGGKTIDRFLAARAIDAMTLSTIPIVLGGGIPLFGNPAAPELRPALASVRRFPSGLVQSHYRLSP